MTYVIIFMLSLILGLFIGYINGVHDADSNSEEFLLSWVRSHLDGDDNELG